MVSQSSSVGYTIMGKTADLTVVQKTTIDGQDDIDDILIIWPAPVYIYIYI